MKMKKRAIAAVALSAVMVCGVLAGCDGLTTDDARKDYEQVVATVNLTASDDFKEGGKYAGKNYEKVVTTSEITKRDLVSLFASQGGSLVNGGYSYADAFDTICDTLINRQIYIQYAKVYFLQNGAVAEGSEEKATFSVSGYEAAVNAASEAYKDASAAKKKLEEEIAGLGYFLTDAEEKKAIYDLKSSVNDALDSQEESIISATDDHDHDEDVRTIPTGVNTEEEDYYPENYEIYTGTSRHVAECGEYEPVEGSTATTRRKAYTQFLSNLRSYALLYSGEDTTEIESLVYYSMEVKSAYESALLQKLNDQYEKEAEDILTKKQTEDSDWVAKQFEMKLASQQAAYKDDAEAFETALDGVSDTSFVLTAPEANYGFVINILLPFSEAQKQELTDAPIDSGDKKGNKFAQRAAILQNVTATDQRGTWFTGHDDYSFDYTEKEGATAYNGGDDARKYLFFEDCLPDAEGNTGTEYEALKNYYGKYTYNGKVTEKEEKGHTHYTLTPNKISIDGFLAEVTNYLGSATYGASATPLTVTPDETIDTANYFTKSATDYYYGSTTPEHKKGDIDYSQFVYASGYVAGDATFDPNKMFVRGSWENTAFSVINELSFAYNTDTAGLNSYLGYAVTPAKTDFVSEFEYAAQQAVKAGAGHYIVVPSEYGWHFIYCTFSFKEANTSPFEYKDAEKGEEGTFSYLFFESLKEQSISQYTSDKQTQVINGYVEVCSEKFEDRYSDLANINA